MQRKNHPVKGVVFVFLRVPGTPCGPPKFIRIACRHRQ